MAAFDPRLPDVQAHVSVTQGVQDNTASQVVELAGKVGMAAWQGKVQADLVGAESHEDSVSTADEYGAFEYDDDGNPLHLAIDTDLTKIANARKQGRLSASRTRAQANLRIREAINDNPMFAKEIADRGKRFFGNVLGGSGTGTGSVSVLEPTREEKLEEKLHEARITDLAAEELEAEKLGLDVPTYREYQRHAFMNKFNVEQLESNERLNQVEVHRGISSAQALAESFIMADLAAVREASGDLQSEPVRQQLRARTLQHRNTMIASINRHRADVGGPTATAMEENVGRWSDNIIELIDSGNMEEMSRAGLEHTETMAKLQTWNEMPSVMRMFTVSPELGKMHLDMLTSNPARLKLLSAAFPEARFLQNHVGADSFDATKIMAPYLGEAMLEFATGERTPAPEGMDENQNMEVARDFVAIETIAAGKATYPMLQHLQEMANDTPEALGALLTRGNRQKMNNDPAYYAEAEQALRVGVEGIQRSLVRGDYSLGMIDVRPTTDKERRMANHPRVDGFGAGRWRGLHDTKIEPDEEAVRKWAIDRQRGVRDNTNPEDLAKRLQAVISVAEQYPDMKINGVNAKEYITSILGGGAPPESPPAEGGDQVSLLDRIISPANATFGDTIIEPGSIADQDARSRAQPVQDRVEGMPFLQDVEFNDRVPVDGEESEVGSLVVSPMAEESAVDSVYSHLAGREGVGDTLTDVPTGNMGVTESARKATGATDDTPDHEVAHDYLELLDNTFTSKVKGYKESPNNVKSMILDAGYNVGEGMANWPKFGAAMAEGDYRKAGLELLNSANSHGMTVRGLALRRAESFNLLGEEQIAFVEQDEDGRVKYLDKDDNVIFEYNTDKGRFYMVKADGTVSQSLPKKSPVLTAEKIRTRNEATGMFVKSLEMFGQ